MILFDFDTKSLCNILYKHMLLYSQGKSVILLYKIGSDPPHINLYLYSGNYCEDTISNHIVDCNLFPRRCRIHH